MNKSRGNYINILTWGGLGDALLATPSFRALKEQHPSKKIRVFYLKRHKDIYLNNPHVDALCEASFKHAPLSWILYRLGLMNLFTIDYSFTKPYRNYDKNITSIIGEVLNVTVNNARPEVYLSDDEMQRGREILSNVKGKTIAMGPYTTSSENKLWYKGNWEELVLSMPEYTFIQLGVKKEPKIEGTVDLRGLKIRDSMAVVAHADCFVGVDSFLSHVATALHVPAVVLFGATPPSIFGHAGNTNLFTNATCAPCYEYLADSVCPYSRKCMMELEVTDVKSSIEEKLYEKELLMEVKNK